MYALIFDTISETFYIELLRNFKPSVSRVLTDDGVDFLDDQEIVNTYNSLIEAKKALREKRSYN